MRRLRNGIISVEYDLPLLMQCTAALSQWKKMLLEAHSFPHKVEAKTIV